MGVEIHLHSYFDSLPGSPLPEDRQHIDLIGANENVSNTVVIETSQVPTVGSSATATKLVIWDHVVLTLMLPFQANFRSNKFNSNG